MEEDYNITLEATTDIYCKKEDNTYIEPPKIIKKGSRITLRVPKVISDSTIFNQPNNSKYLPDIIKQFHDKEYFIAKSQLCSANWKVIHS